MPGGGQELQEVPADQAQVQAQVLPTPVLQNIPFPPKLKLEGNLAANWKRYRRVWDNYEIASDLIKQPKAKRTATLLTCIGPDALEIVDGLPFDTEDERTDIDAVLDKLETFCIGETNETYERYVFNRRDQEPTESVDTYIAALRALAKTCNYGPLEDDLIRDRIVVGIRDNSLRQRLLRDPKLTLQSCINTCRTSESSSLKVKEMNREELHAVRVTQPSSSRNKPQQSWKQNEQKGHPHPQCKFCNRNHPRKKEDCPAWGKSCNICHRRNHFALMCPMKQDKHTVNYLEDSSDEEYLLTLEVKEQVVSSEAQEVLTVDEDKPDYPNKLFATMEVNAHKILFQLDCGATVNVLSVKDYQRVHNDPEMKELDSSNATLLMYNRAESPPVGKRTLEVTNRKTNTTYTIEFQIVEDDSRPILGARAIQRMQLITVNNHNIMTVENSSHMLTMLEIESKFSDVFAGDGKLEGQVHLALNGEATPVQLPARKPPVALKEKFKEELQRLVEKEIIAPVTEPTDWISASLVLLKRNGKLRLCIDPKPLNKALKRNHYPLPVIDDLLPDLSKARYFTVADVKNGFWHVCLDEESSKLTTFATPWGRYRWLRMPFGIAPAPEEFQRRLNEALEGLDGTKAIFDDILVYGVGDTDEEALADHDKKLANLLQRCREKQIKLNKDKLQLRLREVPYVGHLMTASGLKPDPSKIAAIAEMPPPTDKQGVLRLLGMANYLQRFAPHLSQVTAPIRSLLKEDTQFLWDEQVQGKSFAELKQILATAPVLQYFDPNKETVLQCDASQYGLGASITQNDHPVSYASRSLTETEERYAQIEKELLAIVFGAERFENYLYGRRVVVETDHKPLESIFKKSLVTAPKRLQRMLMRLQKFDLEVRYKKGTTMYLADTLSRAFVAQTPKEQRPMEAVFQSEMEKELEEIHAIDYVSITDTGLIKLKQAMEADHVMATLKATIETGWPETRKEVPPEIKDFFNFRDELTIQDAIVFKGDRLVIPQSLRSEIKEKIHSSHQGIQGCLRRARQAVYWPNMNKEVEEYIIKCEACTSTKQSSQENR